jgi:hypothetical protein
MSPDAVEHVLTLSQLRGLVSMLEDRGYQPEDFEISEDVAPELSVQLGLTDHLLTVRRKSTGDERLYAVNPGLPWLFAALADLNAGHFGPSELSH